MKNLLLKKLYSFFKKIFIKKNIQTKTTLKSLKKGPVIKNIGIREIKKEGKVINIFFLKLDITIEQKN